MSYSALVIAGLLIGGVFMRIWDSMSQTKIKGDGPMVPPVYELPPVRLFLLHRIHIRSCR